MKASVVFPMLWLCFVGSGCKREEPSLTPASKEPAVAKSSVQLQLHAMTPDSGTQKISAAHELKKELPSSRAAGESQVEIIGIPECDEYLRKYEVCATQHVPQEARVTMMKALENTKMAWRKTVLTPRGKTDLKIACQTALQNAKSSLSQFGCTW